MPIVNHRARQISCKIVYFGPSLGGKTTSIRVIHEALPKEHCSSLRTIETEEDRTLFFDFFSLETAEIGGLRVLFQVYGVPGQSLYRSTRKMVLMGADGIIFVADSAADRLDDNLVAFEDLKDLLAEHNYDYEDIPLVMQYNKRDLPEINPVERLELCLNDRRAPYFESIATEGKGVREAFKAICREVLAKLNRDLMGAQAAHQPPAGVHKAESADASAN